MLVVQKQILTCFSKNKLAENFTRILHFELRHDVRIEKRKNAAVDGALHKRSSGKIARVRFSTINNWLRSGAPKCEIYRVDKKHPTSNLFGVFELKI